MFRDNPAQIMAMIRSGKVIHIGGRPVIVPQPNPKRDDKRRAESIKLAFAFAAICIVWGSTYSCDSLRCGSDLRRSSPQASSRHSVAGSVFVAVWACAGIPAEGVSMDCVTFGALFFSIGHGLLHGREVGGFGWTGRV